MILQQALKEVEVRMGDVDRKYIYAHPSFVKPMLNYIVTDFAKSRGALNDDTIGGMVICDSSEQAKQMFEIFNTDYAESPTAADEVSEEMRYYRPQNLPPFTTSTPKKRGKSNAPP